MSKKTDMSGEKAIMEFLRSDMDHAVRTSRELGKLMEQLRNTHSEVCVSIVMPTHRTKPDYEKDITLFNKMVEEADSRLQRMVADRQRAAVLTSLSEAARSIDFSLGLDSLIVYAGMQFHACVQLPGNMEQQITVGRRFDTDPLCRAIKHRDRYRIIMVSKNRIRLLEIGEEGVRREIENADFPFINTDYYTDDPIKIMQDDFAEKLTREFFNVADKRFQKYHKADPLPVILAGDIKSVAYYSDMMDDKRMVIGKIHGNFNKEPLQKLLDAARPLREQYGRLRERTTLSSLENAASSKKIVTDPDRIYDAALAGQGKELFIADGFTLSGTVVNEWDQSENIDVLPSLFSHVWNHGGDVRFVDDSYMEPYEGIALVTRY